MTVELVANGVTHADIRNAMEHAVQLQVRLELTIDDIALDETQARLTVSGVADQPGIAAAVFEAVADGGIFVDMIVQSYGRQGMAKKVGSATHPPFDTRPDNFVPAQKCAALPH